MAEQQQRLGALERDVDVLKNDMHDVKQSLTTIVGSLRDVNNSLIEMRATRPLSMRDNLITGSIMAGFVSAVITAIFFLVDARVGAQTEKAVAFAAEQQHEGKIYRLYERVAHIERAISWQPKLVSVDPAGRLLD